MPASSPGVESRIVARKPFCSAQRRYMRSSISAQSCDSVPPAPGWMVTMALRASFSPESSVLVSSSSTLARQLEVGVDVVAAALQVGLGGQRFFQPLALPHHLLRLFRIRPEVGVGGFLFQFG